MRTSEFVEILKNRGYEVVFRGSVIKILDRIDDCVENLVAVVYLKDMHCIDMTWCGNLDMKESKRAELFDLVAEYASTPIAEREEEKRYRLKLINKTVHEGVSYLNEITSDGGKYFLSSNVQFVKNIRNVFTESELKDIDETGFKRVEVTH